MAKKIGKQTLKLENRPTIINTASVVGPKEGSGPLNKYFDIILQDDMDGKSSFEKAETSLMFQSITEVLKKANKTAKDIDYVFAGDLLNQLMASHFAMRDIGIPFFGLYGACSTMAESLSLAAITMDGGGPKNVIAATSSHFASAERQFRFPLEYGAQRCETSQWTVTGSGAMLLSRDKVQGRPVVSYVTTGKVKDYGIPDPNNMGAAMTPAALDTLRCHFEDTGFKPDDYDIIATGDLGEIGGSLLVKLIKEYGYDISKQYIDCGSEIFYKDKSVCAGGSGCGCSAVVASGYLYNELLSGKFKRVLLMSTGALMSTTSNQQGETIPGIAHAVTIEMEEDK